MIICGLDYSVNSPAVVKATLDENLDVVDLSYKGVTSVNKVAQTDSNLSLYHKSNDFKDNISKAIWMKDQITEFMFTDKIDYCAIEGYAMAAKGKVFDIAETTMITKLEIYKHYVPLRIYPPTTIKKFAKVPGVYHKKEKIDSKIKMNAFYELYEGMKLDLDHFPVAKVPKEDIIDAFFTLRFLQLELKLRYGLVMLKDLPLEHIEIFNTTSKTNKVNILARDFILKGKD